MMLYPPMSELAAKAGSRYLLVIRQWINNDHE